MTLPLIFLWIFIISLTSVAASYYVKKYDRPDILIGLYLTLVTVANIVAQKIIQYDFGTFTLFATAGTILFAVTYLITDIVNERFGRNEARRMVLIAFLMQVVVAVFMFMAISATPAPFYSNNDAFGSILGNSLRVIVASLIAFLICEMLDVYVFHWLKKMTNDKHLWMRSAFSTLPAMAIDSILFVLLAFFGVMPILPIITGLVIVKWLVGILDIPFMYISRYIMNK
jgi:queuosine precursor transporter